jgi:hypothetical protein
MYGLKGAKKALRSPPLPAYSPATTAFAAKTFEGMTSPAPVDNASSFASLDAALEYLGAEAMIAPV